MHPGTSTSTYMPSWPPSRATGCVADALHRRPRPLDGAATTSVLQWPRRTALDGSIAAGRVRLRGAAGLPAQDSACFPDGCAGGERRRDGCRLVR